MSYLVKTVNNQPADNDLEGGNTSKGQSSLAAVFLQLVLVADAAAAVDADAAAVGVAGVAVADETGNAFNI